MRQILKKQNNNSMDLSEKGDPKKTLFLSVSAGSDPPKSDSPPEKISPVCIWRALFSLLVLTSIKLLLFLSLPCPGFRIT